MEGLAFFLENVQVDIEALQKEIGRQLDVLRQANSAMQSKTNWHRLLDHLFRQ